MTKVHVHVKSCRLSAFSERYLPVAEAGLHFATKLSFVALVLKDTLSLEIKT